MRLQEQLRVHVLHVARYQDDDTTSTRTQTAHAAQATEDVWMSNLEALPELVKGPQGRQSDGHVIVAA